MLVTELFADEPTRGQSIRGMFYGKLGLDSCSAILLNVVYP